MRRSSRYLRGWFEDMKFKLVESIDDRLVEEYYYKVDFNYINDKGKKLKDYVYIISDINYNQPAYNLKNEISQIMIKRKIPHESSNRKWKNKLKGFKADDIVNISMITKKDALRNQDHLLITTSKDLRDETRKNASSEPIIPVGAEKGSKYLIHHPEGNELLSKDPKESSYIIYDANKRHHADAIHQILHVANINPKDMNKQIVKLKSNPIRVFDPDANAYITRELIVALY